MFRAVSFARRMPLLGAAIVLVVACAALGFAASEAMAAPYGTSEMRVLFATDPSETTPGTHPDAAIGTPASLTRATGMKTTVAPTTNVSAALQASRSADYEIIIAPSHVIASALRNGYTLVATSGRRRTYALLAAAGATDTTQIASKRFYLPQRESLQTFVAKNMLLESGVRLETLAKVRYGQTMDGGLVALELNMADVTVADFDQAQEWIAKNPMKARVLKRSRPVLSGMSIAVRNDVCAVECPRIAAWVQSAEGSIPGVGRFRLAESGATAEFVEIAALVGNDMPAVLAAKATLPGSKN